ncbi:hypothetical protein ACSNOK_34365, partial [Streptomyces sp. URMC 126]
SLDAKNNPLVEIDAVVPWEEFRPVLEQVWRKAMDAVLMVKALVLSAHQARPSIHLGTLNPGQALAAYSLWPLTRSICVRELIASTIWPRV